MATSFFEQPILNSPYEKPQQHWEFSENGLPTDHITNRRRRADFFMPIPKSRKRKKTTQAQLDFSEGKANDAIPNYEVSQNILAVRNLIDAWRMKPNPKDWNVTPITQRLLQHWRKKEWEGRRPFFCQVEAVETIIWLTEVAPKLKTGKELLAKLEDSSREANPLLIRWALKLATGAGKTTVMSMLIAWNTLNAVRTPNSDRFTRAFLIVAPGITIRDRLRVLLPNDPDNYYSNHQIVPADLLGEMQRAKIVITNYHAFKLRERIKLSKGTRQLLNGRNEEAINTLETEGQMIQRVMSELMGMKKVMVINDEAHHCYREKPQADEDGFTESDLKGDERKQAKKDNEAARLWISGLEMVQQKIGITKVIDLSATPFFLKGSGYPEGFIFGWTVSDFSLMDAIECGIVKLPRVPIADNIPGAEVPMYRNLWENIRKEMPKKGRAKNGELDPQSLPVRLQTALEALYGHYEKTFDIWEKANIVVPPCFIVVCNNTATSKLVFDFISGYRRESGDFVKARFPLFSNFDEHGNPMGRPNTLLIDSEQLESGEALDDKFRQMAAPEIDRFRREIIERSGGKIDAKDITDQDLLREVMNTVGEKGKLGESIRCVVSVSMLTEGWDANNVTHILGVRAFGTQLLCEQVIGRALRRQSYQLNEEGLFNVEYADVLGIPFDFNAEAVIADPRPPQERTHVTAVRPEREHLEIRFPRVIGYRIKKLPTQISAVFNEDHHFQLTPKIVGATKTRNAGIIGKEIDLTLEHQADIRPSALIMELTARLVHTKFRDQHGQADMGIFNKLRKIVRQWLSECLECVGGTYPAQLKYQALADEACDRINSAINQAIVAKGADENYMLALLDPYNPTGSSHFVNFYTTRRELWAANHERCPINYVLYDSSWEAEFCRVAEAHPLVLRYIKNQGLNFTVPYRHEGIVKNYIPDFIVIVEDGHGKDDPLHLIVEVKGYRGEDAKAKKLTMDTYWIPGVNALKTYGRWAFAEFRDVFEMEEDFNVLMEKEMNDIIKQVVVDNPTEAPV